MGNSNAKSSLRDAIVYLNISAKPVDAADDRFWSQIWLEEPTSAGQLIKSVSVQEIRMLRDGSPRNFATLIYKMVECMCLATGTLCNTQSQQTAVLNSTRILARLVPCVFEHKRWRRFFENNSLQHRAGIVKLTWPQEVHSDRDYESYLPPSVCSIKRTETSTLRDTGSENDLLQNTEEELNKPEEDLTSTNQNQLMSSLLMAICDLLFCPEFTVLPHSNHSIRSVDAPPEDLRSLESFEYVWEPGVGFELPVNSTSDYDKSRIELLRLLLVSFTCNIYGDSFSVDNPWIEIFTSDSNRHALPLFTSLLNTVLEYKPRKLPLFSQNSREELVEVAIRILLVSLQHGLRNTTFGEDKKNLFNHYASRIHKVEDLTFMVDGFTKLFNYRFVKSYLLNTTQHVSFEPELLYLFWWMCNLNSKFVTHVMQSKDLLKLVVPILYHMNENFQDTSKSTIVHISVYNLFILSSERNFGVVVNKSHSNSELGNLPSFSGTYADLIIIVVHKLILYGQDLNDLFEPLLTIIFNMSPYIKSLSKLASKCLIQMFEVFSSPAVVFTEPRYHKLITYLLDIFNNLIQYQFVGNSNLVYSIVKRKGAFVNLKNLPETEQEIHRVLKKVVKKLQNRKLHELSSTDKKLEKLTYSKNDKTTPENITPQPAFAENGNPFLDKKTTSPVKEHPNENLLDQLLALDSNSNVEPTTVQTFKFSEDTLGSIVGQQVVESTELNYEDSVEVECNEQRDDKTPDKEVKNLEPGDKLINENSTREHPEIWRPTHDWVQTWKSTLPLQTTMRMIEVLEPQIECIITDSTINQQTENRVLDFLKNVTLVGLLPVPHPIQMRKYQLDIDMIHWIGTSTLWLICTRDTLWRDTATKLVKF